ncbi:unnamed protein product [Blepharisma stoltei]|uniref:Uncharacterized protein n=1 Tax=Blepharisma stoltei TaxID=1481888 RepID=A0AAU9KHI9_9CILI|nr:unnamed protein product [Blepharisma stoltei]
MHRHSSLPQLFYSKPSLEEGLKDKIKIKPSKCSQNTRLITHKQRTPFALSLGTNELQDFRFAPSNSKRLPPLLPLQHKFKRRNSEQTTPTFGILKEIAIPLGVRLHRRNESAINLRRLLKNSNL